MPAEREARGGQRGAAARGRARDSAAVAACGAGLGGGACGVFARASGCFRNLRPTRIHPPVRPDSSRLRRSAARPRPLPAPPPTFETLRSRLSTAGLSTFRQETHLKRRRFVSGRATGRKARFVGLAGSRPRRPPHRPSGLAARPSLRSFTVRLPRAEFRPRAPTRAQRFGDGSLLSCKPKKGLPPFLGLLSAFRCAKPRGAAPDPNARRTTLDFRTFDFGPSTNGLSTFGPRRIRNRYSLGWPTGLFRMGSCFSVKPRSLRMPSVSWVARGTVARPTAWQ